MKILGLDSSGLVAGVAVLEDDELVAEYTTNYKKTHSQTLLPMLDELCRMIELDLQTIDAIAIACGPGSFTGLRIGSATAKGLGLALKKPLVEVPTLEGLAWNLYGSERIVCPLMDARRSQTYTGLYEFRSKDGTEEYDMNVIKEQCAVAIEEILEACNEQACKQGGRGVIFLGDGVPVFREEIAGLLTVHCGFAPAHMNRQRAAAVAALAAKYYRQGKVQTAAEYTPEYLRLSQAERERNAQSAAQASEKTK